MSAMNFCPSCGAKLMEGAIFCASCGAKLQEMARTEIAETQQVDNLLAMARLSFSKGELKEFDKYFDQIIAIDFRNLDAWIMKASGRVNEKDVKTFYDLFPDAVDRQKLLNAIEDKIEFKIWEGLGGLLENALKYERIDAKLADIYIANTLQGKSEIDKENIVKLREGYKKEERTEPMDVASCNAALITLGGYFKRMYNPGNFKSVVALVQTIDLPRYEKCLPVISSYADLWISFFEDAQKFKKWDGIKKDKFTYSHYLEPAFDDRTLKEFAENVKMLASIKTRFSTLETEKYWLNHPEKEHERQEKVQEIEEEINTLEKKRDKAERAFEKIPVVQQYRDISSDIERIRWELVGIGMFNFSQKKSKKEQLAENLRKRQELETEYQEVNEKHESLCNDLDNQINRLRQQQQEVYDSYEPFRKRIP